MTPEEFENTLRKSTCEQFVAAVSVLDDKQRKSLLKIVKAVRKDVSGELDDSNSPATAGEWEKIQAAIKRWRGNNPYVESNIVLGLLACGTAADAHRAQLWGMGWEWQEFIAPVLIARNPVWLDTWVNKRLGSEFPELEWKQVREFLQAGVIEKPEADGYITLFIEAMRGFDDKNPASYVPTSERLRREPEFLEYEVWRIFEFENHALTSDWFRNYNDAPPNYETWPEAIVRLANDGDVDRKRMLDLTLSSMQQEMKQNQLSAYGKLHEALAPTADEMAARHEAYFDLLVSPIGPVVSFATKMLGKLHRAGRLDAGLYVDGIRPVFAHKAKGTAMQALKILDKLGAKDDQLFPKVIEVAVAAMAHQSPDVQEFALGLLEKGAAQVNAATLEDIERHIPFLSAKLQKRANALLGENDEASQVQEPGVEYDVDLVAAVESLTPELRDLVGISGEVGEVMPPPLHYKLLDLPGVADREPLNPVESREELLELAARLLEGVESADQVEVLLQGIARFGNQRSGDFSKFAAPLVQRMETGQPSSDGLCTGGGAICIALIDLLMTWLTGRRYDSRKSPYYDVSPQDRFAVARIREIQETLAYSSDSLLLSVPSYKNGWLDPGDFADRALKASDESEFLEFDMMQALLRLGPGDRRAALQSAASIKGKTGRLARFALGGDESPTRKDRGDAHLWYCAARARCPELNSSELLSPIAGKAPKLPGASYTDTWNWSVEATEVRGYRHSKIILDEDQFTVVDRRNIYNRNRVSEVARKLTEPPWRKWPTVALRSRLKQSWFSMYQFSAPWKIHWLAMQHPADTESFMSVGVPTLDARSDENTSRDTPVHAFFSALFDLTRPWGDVSNLAVCLGLLSRSSDSRGYAIDALIPAIESGHADISKIAKVFSKLLDGGAYKINRFSPAMTAVLDVSDLHKWWVGSVVDELVGQLDAVPKGAHFLYETALECMLPLNLRSTDAMAARLKTHKGSSKTAKLAKELLALEGPTIQEPGSALIFAAWLGRLQFVKS